LSIRAAFGKAFAVLARFFTSSNDFLESDVEFVLSKLKNLAKTAKALPNAARMDNIDRGSETERYVNVDDVIHHIMTVWYEVENREHETILNLFHDADANKNGLLDIKEFEAIVNKIVEPNIDRRTMLKLFRQGGYENIKGEIELPPEDFATILKKFMQSRKS
jgi:hypothetical protein